MVAGDDLARNDGGQPKRLARTCAPVAHYRSMPPMLFSKAGSSYAVEHAMEAFKKRPSISQIYASYLAKFLEIEGVYEFLLGLLKDTSLFDWL